MELLRAAEMKRADERAIGELGIPGVVLMENAGIKVFEEIVKLGPQKSNKFVIVCGGGNNGGDGFVVARHLASTGAEVIVLALVAKEKYQGDAAVNLQMLTHTSTSIYHILKETDLFLVDSSFKGTSLVVDAIFGIGLSREVRGLHKEVINKINSFSGKVVSVDIPSGINADTGEIMAVAVKASLTVTFAFPKRGLYLYPGRNYCGKIKTVNIFIPSFLGEEEGGNTYLVTGEKVASLLPIRLGDGHKGSYGRVFVLAGAPGYTGAAYLTSMAAQRSGAGLVTLGIPSGLNNIMESLLIEVMTAPLQETVNGTVSHNALSSILTHVKLAQSIAIGPGLAGKEEIRDILLNLMEQYEGPMVIDADGLNALSKDTEKLSKASASLILTPHYGEMSRLCDIPILKIKKNSIEIAREMAQRWQVVLVLKGAPTIIANPQGLVYINPTGNDGMATAGTGDVLAGLIAGFAAQGSSPIDSAIAGVYIHGLAGDNVAQKIGSRGMIASDVLKALPKALHNINQLEEEK